jgi:hypothetical protein
MAYGESDHGTSFPHSFPQILAHNHSLKIQCERQTWKIKILTFYVLPAYLLKIK